MHTTKVKALSKDVHTLFVGNVPKDCTVEELTKIFIPFGEMSIRMKHARVTCHPLGYCFVDFVDRSDADRAITTAPALHVRGNKLQVRWGVRNTKLFVSGLATSADWTEDILPLFAQYGDLNTDFCGLTFSGKTYNRGVVSFTSRSDAERAKSALDKQWHQGARWAVRWEKGENSPVKTTSSAAVTTGPAVTSNGRSSLHGYTEYPLFSVHVSFKATQKNVKVTEKMIFRVYYFVGSHKMTTISIKKQNNDSTQLSSGYAFIHFEDLEAARNAVTQGKSIIAEGCHFRAEYSKHLLRRSGIVWTPEKQGERGEGQERTTGNTQLQPPAPDGVKITPALTLTQQIACSSTLAAPITFCNNLVGPHATIGTVPDISACPVMTPAGLAPGSYYTMPYQYLHPIAHPCQQQQYQEQQQQQHSNTFISCGQSYVVQQSMVHGTCHYSQQPLHENVRCPPMQEYCTHFFHQ